MAKKKKKGAEVAENLNDSPEKKNKSKAVDKAKEAPKKRRSRGTLLSIRGGMQKIAGSDGEEKPATIFDKILDVIFYLALLAFLAWFLYKRVTG